MPFYVGVAELVYASVSEADGAILVGSSPIACTNKNRTFVYQKFCFCLSKPQDWHIIAAQRAVYIISPSGCISSRASVYSPAAS